MKTILFLCMCLISLCQLDARIWTNDAGKTIEADFISADSTNVTVRLPDGRQFVLPMTTLSKADQEFARAQMAAPSLSAAWRMGSQAGELWEVEISPGVSMRFRWCPPTGPGGFQMGSPLAEAGRNRGETLHPVVLTQGFWMAETECTQAQWRSIMGTTVADLAKKDTGSGEPRNAGDDHPIFYVSPGEAMEFCDKASRHLSQNRLELNLPTEAQWEHACRAGTTTTFNVGSILTEADAVFGNGEPKGTRPVGSKKPNAWNLYDMHGNISEWCAAGYEYEYPSELIINPTGSGASGRTVHAHRGGGWYSKAENCRSAHHASLNTNHRSQFIGFRVVLNRAPLTLPTSAHLTSFPVGAHEGSPMVLEITPSVSMRFRWCPPTGTSGFVMGAPSDPKDPKDKGTQRTVVLSKGFWMAETECSQAQWQAVMGVDLQQHVSKVSTGMGASPAPLNLNGIGPDLPMYHVSHVDALSFCAKANLLLAQRRLRMQLPTEAQWEYSCRAGTAGKYAFGPDLSGMYACFDEKTGPKPVGEGAANAWMLRDMHGNVWEWCADGFNPRENPSRLAGKTLTDPITPAAEMRVMRGGGWNHSKEFASSDNCGGSTATSRSNDIGFRPVLVSP